MDQENAGIFVTNFAGTEPFNFWKGFWSQPTDCHIHIPMSKPQLETSSAQTSFSRLSRKKIIIVFLYVSQFKLIFFDTEPSSGDLAFHHINGSFFGTSFAGLKIFSFKFPKQSTFRNYLLDRNMNLSICIIRE